MLQYVTNPTALLETEGTERRKKAYTPPTRRPRCLHHETTIMTEQRLYLVNRPTFVCHSRCSRYGEHTEQASSRAPVSQFADVLQRRYGRHYRRGNPHLQESVPYRQVPPPRVNLFGLLGGCRQPVCGKRSCCRTLTDIMQPPVLLHQKSIQCPTTTFHIVNDNPITFFCPKYGQESHVCTQDTPRLRSSEMHLVVGQRYFMFRIENAESTHNSLFRMQNYVFFLRFCNIEFANFK